MYFLKLPAHHAKKTRPTAPFIMAWWAAVLFSLTLFMPSKGYAIERDPYLYRSLLGKIHFEFEKDTTQEKNGAKSESTRFEQNYSLDFKGNIFSRYLLIYDAGVQFVSTDYNTTASNLTIRDINYYLRTTILPKSAIPLTLYGSIFDENLSGGASLSGHTTTTYGLNWFSRLKPFPTLAVYAERVHDKGDNADTETTSFRIRAEKEIGPTKNAVEYAYQGSDRLKSDTPGVTSQTINATNGTKISNSTNLSVAGTRSTSAGSTSGDTALEALGMHLISRPSQEFNQAHSYTFFSNKNPNQKQTGSTYSGDLDYSFSERLKSSLGLTLSTTDDVNPSGSFKSESVSTADSINYAISRNLSVSEAITYFKFTTNAPSVKGNLTDRSLLRVQTIVTYGKSFSWARLNMSYGLGYIEDKTTKKATGKGLEQTVSLALSDINFNPYVGFNARLRSDYIKTLSGDIKGRTTEYGADAFNRKWRKYMLLNASYSKTSVSSWITVLESRTETYRFTGSTDYFKGTRISASAEHINSFNAIQGFSRTTSETLSGEHTRTFLGGNLSLTASFSHLNVFSPGTPQKINTRTYSGKYTRPLLRSLFWSFYVLRNERTDQATFSNFTSVENSFIVPIRSWLFSFEHRYSLTENSIQNITENRYLFRATRTFLRIF